MSPFYGGDRSNYIFVQGAEINAKQFKTSPEQNYRPQLRKQLSFMSFPVAILLQNRNFITSTILRRLKRALNFYIFCF